MTDEQFWRIAIGSAIVGTVPVIRGWFRNRFLKDGTSFGEWLSREGYALGSRWSRASPISRALMALTATGLEGALIATRWIGRAAWYVAAFLLAALIALTAWHMLTG